VHNAKPVTIGRVRYPSICAAARAYGIDHSVVISRRRSGWKMLKAVTTPVQSADRSVTVSGQTYRSVSAAVEALGMRYSTVWYRLQKGWGIERAFTEAVNTRASSNARALTVGGKRYRSMAAAAAAFGLDRRVVHDRIQEGWPIKRALSTPVRSVGAGHPVTVKGTRYPSILAAASAHGQPLEMVYSRLRRGWTIERSMSEPPLAPGGHPHTVRFQGRSYESLDTAARALGLSPRLLRSMRTRGLSDEEALARARDRQRELSQVLERREIFKAQASECGIKEREIELRGVRYATLAALAKAFAVRSITLRSRLRRGWTLEQAVGLDERPKLVRNIVEVMVGGQTFPNLSAAARHFGVAWAVARYRLEVGATPEQAFGLAPFEAQRLKTGKRITVGGERFASLSEACRRLKTRHYSVPYWKLCDLIERKGVGPTEAVRMARGSPGVK
jgi:hypothetical protein